MGKKQGEKYEHSIQLGVNQSLEIRSTECGGVLKIGNYHIGMKIYK